MPSPCEFRDDAGEFNYLAAELSTKNMTVQKRAQFMQAEMTELESSLRTAFGRQTSKDKLTPSARSRAGSF